MFDSPEGEIQLHHIGQEYSAPFAELTIAEHNSNSHLLHNSHEDSWRRKQGLETAFEKERAKYWKKRSAKDYTIAEKAFQELPDSESSNRRDYLAELRNLCETIYAQCDAGDLDYLADLAHSYAMMNRLGAATMDSFIEGVHQERKTKLKCPHCGCSDYVRNGNYTTQHEKRPRYKCNHCGKTFSQLSDTLIAGTNFSFREWVKFIDCLYHGYTIKQIAKACEISEKTAQENRIKLFYALSILEGKVKLTGNVVLDQTYFLVSYKGNHSNQGGFVLPREAHKRGGENHKKGISKNHVTVICAVDDEGNSVAKVAGTGQASAAKLRYVLKEHMGEDIQLLYSDKCPILKKFADSCELEIKQAKQLRKNGKPIEDVPRNKETYVVNRYIQIVNSYHSRLKKFLARFSGISTKYLSGYLYLFQWRERTKDQEPEDAYKELLQILTQPDYNLSVENIVKCGYIPEAQDIDKNYRKKPYELSERYEEIYKRFAEGEAMTDIGKDLGVSKQRISQIVEKIREKGLAYRTVWDIQAETQKEKPKKDPICKRSRLILERDYQIYRKRENWTGNPTAFIEKTAQEYGLQPQGVKDILSRVKRIEKLKKEVLIYEEVTFQTKQEVYQAVYADFVSLLKVDPSRSKDSCARELGAKYNFSPMNIHKIYQIMSTDTSGEHFPNKRNRLTKDETFNRDKAIFIDFLRWSGKKTDFYEYAAKKYGLARRSVYTILKYCLYADPKRYDMLG